MNKTTRQKILDRQELNRKLYNKENPMKYKTTDQLLTEFLELNTQHIETLNERIEILKETIEIINSRLLIKSDHVEELIEKIDTLNNLKSKSNE